MSKLSFIGKVIIFSLVILALGSLSSLSVEWVRGVSIGEIYTGFKLPLLAPPGWIFGPTWIGLYVLLGIYCAKLTELKENRQLIYYCMYAQLMLNILWTVVFFTLNNFLLASGMILLMDGLVIALLFFDRRKVRIVLVPYLMWLLFASYLSIAVAILN